MLSDDRHLEYFDHALKPREVTTSHMMRGLTPHEGALGDGKPSKLEMMRADYQRKIMKEKEEKMIQMYEDNQKKVLMRMAMSEPESAPNGVRGGKSVWKYNDRNRSESSGIPSTDNRSRQIKDGPVSKELPGRAESSPSLRLQQSNSARARSHLLAPIRRPPDAQDAAHLPPRPGFPQRLSAGSAGHGDGNPFLGRPRLVKHKPLPPTNHNHVNNKSAGDPKATYAVLPTHKLAPRRSPQTLRQLHPQAADTMKPSVDSRGEIDNSGTQGKLTDFQKWQGEQSQTRDERLKRLNETRKFSSNDNKGAWKLSDDDDVVDDENMEERKSGREERPGSNKGDKQQGEIKSKERELMEKIASRQRELDNIRKEREEQEKQDRQELERKKKKEYAELARQKKMNEERKKEEVKRIKQQENAYRLEIEKAERQRKEEDQQWSADERSANEDDKRRQQQAERNALKRQRETGRASSTPKDSLSARSNCSRNNEDSPSARPSVSVPKASGHPQPSKSKMDTDDPDERRLSLSDAHVYEQAAASYDAQGVVSDLAKCQICGRSFVKDRLGKHQEACVKAHKPRKEFDSAKKRVEGTELAKYAGKAKRSEPPKKKSNWRATHDEFIKSLRYAKKVTKCELEGGDLRNLTPPPASINPDYVPCPHCGRSFNKSAAERHIPRCQSLKTRPLPSNSRRK